MKYSRVPKLCRLFFIPVPFKFSLATHRRRVVWKNSLCLRPLDGAEWKVRLAIKTANGDYITGKQLYQSILTWRRGYRDHEGGSSRARLFHCTTIELTLANIPNVDISDVKFLLVGTAFALSRNKIIQT